MYIYIYIEREREREREREIERERESTGACILRVNIERVEYSLQIVLNQ